MSSTTRIAAALVAMALVGLSPAPASATNVGGGSVTGTVAFTNTGGVPVATAPCRGTTFTLSGRATGIVLNTVLSGHAGDITLSGGGGSTCENAGTAAGTSLTINAIGVGPTGSRVSCSLAGSFVRVAAAVLVDVSGSCSVNYHPAGRVRFLAEVVFTPTVGDGITSNIRAASFAGAFSVIPA